LTEQAADAAIDSACRLLRLPSIRNEFSGIADRAMKDQLTYMPQREELPSESADAMLGRLAQFPAEEREKGPELDRAALAQFTGPVAGNEPHHELVVTHNFLIGWLVRAALDAPKWRWMGINHANAALTVVRYAPGRPPPCFSATT
jgi:probable phosphoglycerate mutase